MDGSGPQLDARGLAHRRAPRDGVVPPPLRADPVVAEELAALGIETPAALGATFLGDSAFLAAWAAGAPPLEDDHPARFSSRIATAAGPEAAVLEANDARLSRERFERSDWVRRVWPATLRAETLAAFDAQDALNRALVRDERPWHLRLDAARQASTYTLAPLLLLGSTPDEQRLRHGGGGTQPDDLVRPLSACARRPGPW